MSKVTLKDKIQLINQVNWWDRFNWALYQEIKNKKKENERIKQPRS